MTPMIVASNKRPYIINSCVLLACFLVGCASIPAKKSYRENLQDGDIVEATKIISDKNNKNDKLLREMQLASISQIKGDYTGSNNRLEKGKNLAEELSATSVTETVAAISVNQRVSPFSGNRFERIMLYFHKALNYLADDDAASARIEISQAELLMQEWRIKADKFSFLPLFIAMIYEKLGDAENALVAYRRAIDAYENNDETPTILKQGYLQLLAKYGQWHELSEAAQKLQTKAKSANKQATLITIVPRGFMTPMDSFTIYHIHPELNQNFQIALPLYDKYVGVAIAPLLSLQQQTGESDSIDIIFENIVNVEIEMRAALKQQMPKITSLALARAVVKYQLQQQTKDNKLAGLFVFAFNTLTEIADTRSWDTLPQAFYFSRVELDPGSYSMKRADREPIDLTIEKGVNFLLLPNYR